MFVAIIFFAVYGHAQEIRAISNHAIHGSISLMPSLGYTFEGAIGNDFVIRASGGIQAFSVSDGNTLTLAGPNVYLSVEPRYYYNLKRRSMKGKTINGNSADFISFEIRPILWAIAPRRYEVYSQVFASFVWGLRRVYDSGFLLEFKGGLDTNLTEGV